MAETCGTIAQGGIIAPAKLGLASTGVEVDEVGLPATDRDPLLPRPPEDAPSGSDIARWYKDGRA